MESNEAIEKIAADVQLQSEVNNNIQKTPH